MPSLLPKMDFAETVNTLLSYLVVVSLTLVIVIFGMNLERHNIGKSCNDNSIIVIEGVEYHCQRKEEST